MSRTSIAVTAWRSGDQSVPPKLQLFLDGKMVGETEVRAYSATGYSFTADLDPSLAHKLQVRYVNDAPGRDLFVGKLQVGAFSIKPTDPGVTYDKGAIDGRDVVAGQEAMWWNGALDFAVPSNVTIPPPATGPDAGDLVAITVKASGTTQDGQAPRFKLLLDGKLIGEASATSSTSKDYSFTASVAADQAHKIQVQYLNDGPQRDFFIQGIRIGGQEIKSTAPDVIYDKGALDGRDVAKGQEAMWWNGTMVFSVPAGFLAPSASTPTAPAPTVPSPAIPSPTVPSTPAPAQPSSDRTASASVSSERPPLSKDVWVKSWGADRGLAPQHLFWETVPDYANASHMALTRDVAADHLAEGVVPVIGMQLWEDTFLKSQPGAQFGSLAGHKAWVSWVEAHPQYLGTNASGKVHYSTTANTEGWGYVSPLMPLDAKDAPAGFTGKTAYYADWLADKLGRLAAHTGTRGFELADFFDGSPHSGVMNYFNPRMIADFSAKTGIAVSGGTLAEQAAWIRAEHPLEWLDYFVKGWSYSWKALTEGIEKHTGQEAWLSNQTSFTPAAMREFAGVDVRELGKVMDLGDLLINVQTLERFTMQHKLAPAAYEQAMLGTHAARAPEGHYGHMLSSSEDDYWNAVNTLYKGVSGTAREELGWDRLEQTWYQSGWTHVAEADGGIRRAAESWSRSYHDWGEVKQGWLDTLRDIVPTRPFGPALYYSANAENAANRLAPTGNDIGNAYLGELLTPITRLHEAGVPFGYYVSDAALGSINASNAPSAWIIPQRYQNGVDLFSDAEIAALKAKAPVLVGDEAIGYKHPLTFTDADPGAQITGYGFYDQKDRLIVVASDRVDFDDTASRGALNVHIGLMLKDGRYTAENLETHAKHAFTVTGGNGGFDVDIGRWDTELFAVTPEAA